MKMSYESLRFLERYLPEALRTENIGKVLKLLGDMIVFNGFEPPDYYDYNDFGREAQSVYDDIYLSNKDEL